MPTREDYHDAFVAAVNHIEPEHSHYNGTHQYEIRRKDGDPHEMWPMALSELETTAKKSTSSKWATAGPRSKQGNHAKFAIDIDYFERHSTERCAAIIVHEVTHITVGSFTTVQAGGHPPRFWETYCEYAERIQDRLDVMGQYIGDIDREGFLEEVAEGPNGTMVDRRYETVEERKALMRERLLQGDMAEPDTSDDEKDPAEMVREIQQEAIAALDG